jgi:tetratricopeptide (TPR) repeat protein
MKRALPFLVVFLLLAGTFAAGLTRVRAGEVLVRGGGDGTVPALHEAGWHWIAPWAKRGLRVPREPIAWSGEVVGRTPEGAALTASVAGRFGLAPGTEATWARRAAARPFFDVLTEVAAFDLTAALKGEFPASDLASSDRVSALRDRLTAALSEAGYEVRDLEVRFDPERNPVLVGAADRTIRDLARPTGRKVLVVGWDGADWLLIRPLLAAGRMPNLARLIERGVSGELRSQEPLLSPLIWTTIATGKPVLEHGIADFLVRDPATGANVPISSGSRKVHALWTMLPAFGLRTDTVAWWATWPAEPTLGTLVSDRVAYQLLDLPTSVDDRGKVFPEEAWPRIRDRLVDAERVDCDLVRRFVALDCAEIKRRWSALPAEHRQDDRVNHLRKILATTLSYHAMTLDLLRDQADLTLVYYEATDTIGHLFARYLPPRLPGITQEEVDRFGSALPAAYVWADELLGELLAAAHEDTTVMVISDHGFYVGEARPATAIEDFGAGAPSWHRLYGIGVMAGPGIPHGELSRATILDVAPTVLGLLGLPRAADMQGRPWVEAAGGGAELASYERLSRRRPASTAVSDPAQDRERIRELVALGYLSAAALEGLDDPAPVTSPGTPPGSPSADPGAHDGTGADEGLATEAYNRGRIHQRKGEYDAAERQFRLAVDRLPSFGLGWAALAQIASLRGDDARAFATLREGLAKSGGMPPSALTGLVDVAREAGLLAEAERTLSALSGSSYARQSAYQAAWGLLHEGRERPGEALDAYRRALAIDPLDQLAIERAIALLGARGDRAGADALFERALAGAAGSIGSLNHLGVVSLRQGFPARAEQIFRRLLASDPGNVGLLANLAAALAQQRKFDEAIAAMRSSVERDPENAQNHFNLGAMLAERGRATEALAAFEQAEGKGLKDPRVYVAIAKMRFRTGDEQGAREALVRALEIDARHAEARALLDVLDSPR